MILDFDAFAATAVSDTPFPHLLVRNFVPPVALEQIVWELPELPAGGSWPPESVKLGPVAKALFGEIEGPRLRAAIAAKFDLDLTDAPSMVTLRGASREKDGRIHTDSVAKRVTVLFYLNPASAAWARQEGCLRLLRSPTDLEDFAVEVPPVDGTLLVFPNGPTTWHGHRTFVGQRYVVQLNYMTNDAKARSELRRHRVSAFLKRLKRAA